MTTPSAILGVPFVAAMVLAAVWDLHSRRIPNPLTVGAAVLASILWWIAAGTGGVIASILGAGAGLAIGIVLFGLGAVGGGDAKLFMVLGAFLGPARLLVAFVLTGIIGAALVIVVAIRAGRLVPVLVGSWKLGLSLVTFGRMGIRKTLGSPDALTVPYGVAIAAGGVITWCLWAVVGT